MNKELDAWRLGAGPAGASPPPPKTDADRTVADLIELYRASPKFRGLAPKTPYDYEWHLEIIRRWAGDKRPKVIGRKLAQAFYGTMQKATPAKANAAMRVARILFNFARDQELVDANPFEKPGLVGTEPRLRIWTPAEIDAMVALADALERPSMGDAILLAYYLGQREGDLLDLTWLQRQADPRGNGYRIRLRQSKRGAWIDVPLAPRLAARLKATRRRLDEHECKAPQIVVSEQTGRRYGGDNFRHRFAEIRAEVVADWQRRHPGANEPCPSADLWFMDLRDTAVTNLATAGCTIPESAPGCGRY